MPCNDVFHLQEASSNWVVHELVLRAQLVAEGRQSRSRSAAAAQGVSKTEVISAILELDAHADLDPPEATTLKALMGQLRYGLLSVLKKDLFRPVLGLAASAILMLLAEHHNLCLSMQAALAVSLRLRLSCMCVDCAPVVE